MNSRNSLSPSEEMDIDSSTVRFTVKFAGDSLPISISPDSTIRDLKTLLQELTDVLPRGQKLIARGKILKDDMTITASEITNGSKIMLVASQGLHQGEGPLLKQAQSKPISRTGNANRPGNEKKELEWTGDAYRSRLIRWEMTGVIALSDCNLKAIPDEIWSFKSSARFVDLSNNYIRALPSRIGSLVNIVKLILTSNELEDESVSWEGLASLKRLEILSLIQNRLTILPSVVGGMTFLREFYVANNRLTCLPDEIGLLTRLEVLKANNNRLSILPSTIGDCTALIEVDLSSNYLSALPDTLGNLHKLKSLHLANNGLKSIPGIIFKSCLQLTTLDLHNTEIVMDVLRQCEGWESFDQRRISKHQKQLEFRTGSATFDEGADKN